MSSTIEYKASNFDQYELFNSLMMNDETYETFGERYYVTGISRLIGTNPREVELIVLLKQVVYFD